MKKFDLDAALKGAPVITKNGLPARVICTDAKGKYPLVALILEDNLEVPVKYALDGKRHIENKGNYDLFMVTVKKKGYINIWEHENGKKWAEGIFSTRDEAEKNKEITAIYNAQKVYISTIDIEWEE